MRYGQKITFRWTPRLQIRVMSLAGSLIVLGSTVGFHIGRSQASVKIDVQETYPIETTEAITFISEQTPTALPTKTYYDCPLSKGLQDHIRTLCEEYDLPMDLVIAQIQVESNFRADVISPTNDYGLMQINKINHKRFREEYGVTNFLDPYQNVLCGIVIISENYSRFGDLDKALMAYNMGAAGAKKLWNKGIYSTSYVEKIRAAMNDLQIRGEGI